VSLPAPEEIVIQHNLPAHRFEAQVDGRMSVADYVLDDRRIVFTHTFVPPELRGRGIAEKLVRAGLAFAEAEGRRVIPQCSYVDVFIRRHPEFAKLL
jgi:uncharacterized protein